MPRSLILTPVPAFLSPLQDAMGKGYRKLLGRMGRSFIDFLHELSSFHLPLVMGQPDSLPPDLRVEKVWINGWELTNQLFHTRIDVNSVQK